MTSLPVIDFYRLSLSALSLNFPDLPAAPPLGLGLLLLLALAHPRVEGRRGRQGVRAAELVPSLLKQPGD